MKPLPKGLRAALQSLEKQTRAVIALVKSHGVCCASCEMVPKLGRELGEFADQVRWYERDAIAWNEPLKRKAKRT